MSLYEFASLDLNDKAKTLWECGVFIQSYKDQNQSCNLYFMFGFYIEVKLDNVGAAIIDIIPFKRGPLLDKYLVNINLNL